MRSRYQEYHTLIFLGWFAIDTVTTTSLYQKNNFYNHLRHITPTTAYHTTPSGISVPLAAGPASESRHHLSAALEPLHRRIYIGLLDHFPFYTYTSHHTFLHCLHVESTCRHIISISYPFFVCTPHSLSVSTDARRGMLAT